MKTFNVTPIVQEWRDWNSPSESASNYGFVIKQNTESTTHRISFYSSEVSNTAYWPALRVTYTVPPSTPISVVGTCVAGRCDSTNSSATPGVVTSLTPAIAARSSDVDTAQLTYTFFLREEGQPSTLAPPWVVTVPQTQPATWTVPSGLLIHGGSYEYQVSATDGTTSRTLTDWQSFVVDVPPATPQTFGVSPGGVGYTTSLAPTLSAAVSDPDGDAMTVKFVITDGAGDFVWSGTQTNVPATGPRASVTVSDDDTLEVGQNYTVAITANDGFADSPPAFATFATDLYGASVPAQPCSAADTCIATGSTTPLYTATAIDPGVTVALSPDPAATVDMDYAARIIGSVSITATGTGSLYIYDGDYPEPVEPTMTYNSATAGQTISLTPASDGTVSVRNDGTAPVGVSITATTVDNTAAATTPTESADIWNGVAPPPNGTSNTCTTAVVHEDGQGLEGDGATDATGASPDVCRPTPETPSPSAIPGRRVVNADFPDPTMITDSYYYYLYGTTTPTSNGLFPMYYSRFPASDYQRSSSVTMSSTPAWAEGRYWAPDVAKVGDRYVMYFTALNADNRIDKGCLGVATSSSPFGPFNPASQPLLCSRLDDNNQNSNSIESIDPVYYRDARSGKNWLAYKTSDGNLSRWKIRYVRLNTAGTGLASPTTPRRTLYEPGPIPGETNLLSNKSKRMTENPSLIRNGGKLWLFVSRGDYANSDCRLRDASDRTVDPYSTDVFVSSKGISGKFTRVVDGWLAQRDPDKTPCAPGGADIVLNGDYVVYSARKTQSPGRPRVAYVAQVTWLPNGGRPYVR